MADSTQLWQDHVVIIITLIIISFIIIIISITIIITSYYLSLLFLFVDIAVLFPKTIEDNTSQTLYYLTDKWECSIDFKQTKLELLLVPKLVEHLHVKTLPPPRQSKLTIFIVKQEHWV